MMTSLRNHWKQIQSGLTTSAGPLHHPEVDRQQVAFNIFPFHIGFFAVSIVYLLHDYFYIHAESKPRFSEHITASNRQPEVCLCHFHEGMGVQPAASKHKRKTKTRIQPKRVTYDQCVIYQYYLIFIYTVVYIYMCIICLELDILKELTRERCFLIQQLQPASFVCQDRSKREAKDGWEPWVV